MGASRAGVVHPAEFIPLAEESGLILPLGRCVLGEACRQLAEWRAGGRSQLRVTVNLSARQFADPGLIDVVAEALARALPSAPTPSGWRSPRASSWRRWRPRPTPSTPSSASACTWPSTTSAPATRRSAT